MKIAGHSSVTLSQGYLQLSPEALEQAIERLDVFNRACAKSEKASAQAEGLKPARDFATIQGSVSSKLPVNAGKKKLGPLAQRLEQRTHNPLVRGSNP
jgi:hypothetical protein